MQCFFRANKMVDASVRNINTGDSTDEKMLLFTHRTKWNTFLALSLPCQCMQVLLNRLVYTTKLTKKRDRVALLMYFAFTWSSLKSEKRHQKCNFAQILCTYTLM